MYTIKQISFNWYGIYDKTGRCVIESTSVGIKVYAKLFGCDK